MRTDELVRLLARDLAVKDASINAGVARSLPWALVVTGLVFVLTLGLRADIADRPVMAVVAMKLVVTCSLAATSLFLALRLARSMDFGPRPGVWLAVAPLLLTVLVGGELAHAGIAGWSDRMVGANGWFCLGAVPLLSLPPLAALFRVLRSGAVTRPMLAGFVAGLAATGIGASIYALHCTDDSPLFLALWYGIAALIVSAGGAIAGRALLRW